MKKQTAITIPRSFAALAKAASSDAKSSAWLRTILVEQLADGRVRGTAVDGYGLLRMTADAPEVNLDLFGEVVPAASTGARAAASADDLALVARAVRPPKDGEPPPVEIILGPEPVLRCGSEARRIRVEGGAGPEGWPAAADLDALIPSGDVVCAQIYSAERLRNLLAAVVAAGAGAVKVEMRGGTAGVRLVATGEHGEEIDGVLMPMRVQGEVDGGIETVTVSCGGESVTLTAEQFERAARGESRP
jgi:hypothetical protein